MNAFGHNKKKTNKQTSSEDTLNHLQNIRESVVQMKNSTSSSHHNHNHHHHNQHYYMASGLINPAVSCKHLVIHKILYYKY